MTKSKRRFQDWWASHATTNDVPDFLRRDSDPDSKPVPTMTKESFSRLSSGPRVTGS